MITQTKPVITGFDWVPDFARGKVRDLRIRWAFEELGVAYDTKLFGAATPRPESYCDWQPFDQVPAFSDGDLQFFESGAILLYLAEKYGHLLPADRQGRWQAISWLFAALNSVEPFLGRVVNYDIFHAKEPWAKEARVPAAELADRKLKRLSDALGEKEWFATRFSIADIAMVTVLGVLDHTDMIAQYPNLAAYKQRGLDRPAYRRALNAQLSDFTAEPPKQMQGA